VENPPPSSSFSEARSRFIIDIASVRVFSAVTVMKLPAVESNVSAVYAHIYVHIYTFLHVYMHICMYITVRKLLAVQRNVSGV